MIVGLNGRKGAGKDTAGRYLVEEHGFVRQSFADLLKESAAACFGITPSKWDEWKNDPDAVIAIFDDEERLTPYTTITVRQFLQYYGTEAHRDLFGKDFWVEALFESESFERSTENIVITDARFPNELKAIRDEGGLTIRIERPGVEAGDEHQSEADPPWDLIDTIVYNNENDLDYLYAQLDIVIRRLSEESRSTYTAIS